MSYAVMLKSFRNSYFYALKFDKNCTEFISSSEFTSQWRMKQILGGRYVPMEVERSLVPQPEDYVRRKKTKFIQLLLIKVLI